MIPGILFFSIVVFAVSFLITKNSSRMDRTEIGLYIVLIAWGSMIFGIVMSRIDLRPLLG
jgi:Flp pilus assembly protein TadB